MKDIKYESSRPLMRLEKGDKAIIRVSKPPYATKKFLEKFKDVPVGKYEATVVDEYTLDCEQYPILSGKYTYWYGNKFGYSDGIYADEISQ